MSTTENPFIGPKLLQNEQIVNDYILPANMDIQDETPISSDLFPNKTLLELCKATWKNKTYTDKNQPYVRGCAWSPDGTCCLTVVNTDGQHITELPADLYKGSVCCDRAVDPLNSTIHIKESGLIYDFCWFPAMNSQLPETCCWLSTRQHGPLQLWDGWSGGLRCTYRGYDAVDEMEPALSCAFSVDGANIYAGYRKCVRIFTSERPGRDCVTHAVQAPASCLAPSQALLAVGSWNTTVGLYSVKETGLKCIGRMHGHSGGVTHAKFTSDGSRLVTGARKDDQILVWDVRYYRRPINVLRRAVSTNQRIYFDISPCGRYLVSGGTDGVLRVWDTMLSDWKSASTGENDDNPAFQFQLHEDCCNSVSIHPFLPIVATGSGQFHSKDPIISLYDSNENTNSQSETTFHQSVLKIPADTEIFDLKNDEADVEMNETDITFERIGRHCIEISNAETGVEDNKFNNHNQQILQNNGNKIFENNDQSRRLLTEQDEITVNLSHLSKDTDVPTDNSIKIGLSEPEMMLESELVHDVPEPLIPDKLKLEERLQPQMEEPTTQQDASMEPSELTTENAPQLDDAKSTQIQFRNDQSSGSSSDESEKSVDISDLQVNAEVKCENSLVFWWIGHVPDL